MIELVMLVKTEEWEGIYEFKARPKEWSKWSAVINYILDREARTRHILRLLLEY